MVDSPNPKVEQKRLAILRNALKVFAKEGFRNADVQVIADLAKVGKGTVYRHFGNKEQLFLATSRHCLDQMAKFIEDKLGSRDLHDVVHRLGALDALRMIAVAAADFYQLRPQAVEIMLQERAEFREAVFPSHLMFRSETRSGFEDMLKYAIERGELRQVDPVQVTNVFADLLFGTVVNGVLEGGRDRLTQRVSQAVELLISGLAAPPANTN